jgi:5'-nucleotidase
MTSKSTALSLALAAALLTAAPQPARPVTVQLLAINDFHGNLEPPTGTDGQVNQVPAGGAEYLATHLRRAVSANPNSLFVAAGDLLGASPLISGLFHDGPTIEAMNAMNLAVTSIGNHELDHGPAEFLHRIAGGCLRDDGCGPGEQSAPARFRYLAANVLRGHDPLLPPTAVRTVAGVKIGFIGETLLGTDHMISAPAAKGLTFEEESAAANQAAARLEKEGVRAIVLLIHQGGGQRPEKGPADPNGCENFQGAIGSIAAKLSPAIKVVLSAHSHQFYNCSISGHVVTSAGSYGRLFTRVTLSIDPATDTITAVTARNEVVTRDVEKDPAVTAILDRFRPGANRLANRPIGSITAEFNRTRTESGESALGELIADAQLASVQSPEKGGAMVSFMNSGGIRANLLGKESSPGHRNVSYGDLFTVQPFANQLQVLTLTGDALRRLLEQQFSGRGGGRILQVSEGFSYRYRTQAPEGQHIVPGSVQINGRPVAPTDRIRVAASDFLLNGGDSFTVFAEGTGVTVGPVDIDALVAYVAAHSPVPPRPLNRIVRID